MRELLVSLTFVFFGVLLIIYSEPLARAQVNLRANRIWSRILGVSVGEGQVIAMRVVFILMGVAVAVGGPLYIVWA